MSAKFSNWQIGLTFIAGASISFFICSSLNLSTPLPSKFEARARAKPKPEGKNVACDNEPSHANDDGDLRDAVIAPNESAINELQHELESTVLWTDLSILFTRWGTIYRSSIRRLLRTHNLKSRDCRGNNSQKPANCDRFLSVPQKPPEILRPLAAEVTSLLEQYSGQDCNSRDYNLGSAVYNALRNGDSLWSQFARAVVQLDHRIVVKIGNNISLTDADMTAHIRKYSPGIPVPEPLGVITFGSTTYSFMSLVQGKPLDKLWPCLSDDDKCSIQSQLNTILEELRLHPLPSQYLGGGSPPQCTDCRMWKRQSPERIDTEAQFNEFLLSGNKRAGMEPYVDFVRPMLRDDHRIVLTHGDLHPRNIMVDMRNDNTKDGLVSAGERPLVTGLIDWEVSGAYPVYWEFVKSLNTVRPIRAGDWLFFLPTRGMGQYFEE